MRKACGSRDWRGNDLNRKERGGERSRPALTPLSHVLRLCGNSPMLQASCVSFCLAVAVCGV